jgi:tRNA G18 (ribose-2'-O)-methylase SpoU
MMCLLSLIGHQHEQHVKQPPFDATQQLWGVADTIEANQTSRAVGDGGLLRLELLLYALQSPINLGMILRVAETYGVRVAIHDRHGVLDDPDKVATMEDFSCGAAERWGFQRIDDTAALERLRTGRRLIATSIEADSRALSDHRFQPADLIVLGNEYDGLPDDVVATADLTLWVPMPAVWTPKPPSRNPIDPRRTASVARDGKPNLNVAMTAGIICYSAYAGWLANRAAESTG